MQNKHKMEHPQKTPVILRAYCSECKVNEYTLVFDSDKNKLPIVKCLHCGWVIATPEAFTFANFDGDFRTFCLVCNIDKPTIVIEVDKNKQPIIKCLRCGFTLTTAEFDMTLEIHPILMKNTKLLVQALRETVRKALAYAESLPARPKPKLIPTVKPAVNPEKTEVKPMPAVKPETATTLNASQETSPESLLLPEPTQPRVPAPEKTEAKPIPAPKTESKPELPRPMPAPPDTNVEDLVRLVLSHLEDFWTGRKIPGETLRYIIAMICGKKANAVWKLLFPAHVVKLHTTDFFILREHERRPKGYEGLVDYAGVLPSDEPAPF